MGHRGKAKNNPIPIYRSRQAGRTDIEELLGPAFNPHQRSTVDKGKANSLPRPEIVSDQFEEPSSRLEAAVSVPAKDIALQSNLEPIELEQRDLPALLLDASAAENQNNKTISPPTVVTDSVDTDLMPEADRHKEYIFERVDSVTTVGNDLLTTVDGGLTQLLVSPSLDTVDTNTESPPRFDSKMANISTAGRPLSTVPGACNFPSQWITEQGQVVSEKQVRPFKMAQDALNSNERVLYTVLWNNKEAKIDPSHPHMRTVRAGYDYLAKQTNLAKKTIQRLIPRLLQKDFIRIEETPDFYNRVAASYRVFSYKHVLETAAEHGRTHVAKLGHGIAFVRQRPKPIVDKNQIPLTTVGSDSLPTVDQKSTVSVPSPPLPTVVRKSTILETRSSSKGGTTTAPSELYEKLEALIPAIDTGAVERIWREGREVVADIQPEEIAHWFEQRAKLVYQNRGLKNPLGLLLSSVKDWLTERKVVNRRKELRELAEEQQRVRQQLEDDQHAWEGKHGRNVN